MAPLSVALVVVTLGAAFGILSGRGAIIGMVSTLVIVFFTTLFGGSRYGVSSPTGPMTAAIAVILAQNVGLSSENLLGLTLILTAIILFLLSRTAILKLVKMVPNLVVSGFVNGIALLIIISQINAVDLQIDWVIMLVTFGVAVLAKRHAFMVIVAMSAVTFLLNLSPSYLNISQTFSALEFSLPAFESLNFTNLMSILPLSFELAIIALLDTLLTALIVDKETGEKTNMPKELGGQSLSLAALSFFGGIPGAQSTVPSMTLLKEGGNNKYAKPLMTVFCLLLVLVFAPLIKYVPIAVFGGVILKIALDVADLTSIKSILKKDAHHRWVQLFVLLGTCLSTVLISLNLAVIGFTFLFVFWNRIVGKEWRLPDLRFKEQEGLIDEV
jgi:SulP family sulfate permease